VERPGQMTPTDFERAILERIATAHPDLRQYLGHLHVLSREFTGVGSYTTFRCEESSLDSPKQQLGFNELIAVPGVPNGMGAVLYCRAGRPECLETFTFGNDHWDGEHDGFSIAAAV
jgi:hypothetical protein